MVWRGGGGKVWSGGGGKGLWKAGLANDDTIGGLNSEASNSNIGNKYKGSGDGVTML